MNNVKVSSSYHTKLAAETDFCQFGLTREPSTNCKVTLNQVQNMIYPSAVAIVSESNAATLSLVFSSLSKVIQLSRHVLTIKIMLHLNA